jgi:hypothetical protein
MPQLFLVSYATDQFQRVRCELNASAIEVGIPKSNILSYSLDDLHGSAFYRENREILDAVCGAGYWAWKPYFILEAMTQLDDGDALFYCDAGSLFAASPAPLIDLCLRSDSGVVLFDARPLTNRQFTKRDCFVCLGCDEAKYWDSFEVIATVLVLRKCEFVLRFLKEWLGYCRDARAITDQPNTCGMKDLPGFIQHRWDQAILSVLAAKHSLETYRNPTLWGNFLKLPEFRADGEIVASPYNLVPSISDYAKLPQENSRYGTIFIINRQPNVVGKKPIVPPAAEMTGKRDWSLTLRSATWIRRVGRRLRIR